MTASLKVIDLLYLYTVSRGYPNPLPNSERGISDTIFGEFLRLVSEEEIVGWGQSGQL